MSIEFPIGRHIIGMVFFFLGSMLFTWSMVSNKYFSTMVRIQDELGHKVADEGSYRFVRHPGYVGFIVMALATPIALGSIHALFLSIIVSIIFIIRNKYGYVFMPSFQEINSQCV